MREDEDGLQLDEDDGDDSSETSSVTAKNYITPKGAEKLKVELRELRDGERPKLVETVAWAASNGDRSENADYIYGKRRLREIDKRMRFLTRRLELAEVIDPAEQSGPVILFGATVTAEDEDGAKRVYSIVGVDETDASRGHVSWVSPIGKALLQARAGDAVYIKTPKGEVELTILKIEYKEII